MCICIRYIYILHFNNASTKDNTLNNTRTSVRKCRNKCIRKTYKCQLLDRWPSKTRQKECTYIYKYIPVGAAAKDEALNVTVEGDIKRVGVLDLESRGITWNGISRDITVHTCRLAYLGDGAGGGGVTPRDSDGLNPTSSVHDDDDDDDGDGDDGYDGDDDGDDGDDGDYDDDSDDDDGDGDDGDDDGDDDDDDV